jgi:hypothetical protein
MPATVTWKDGRVEVFDRCFRFFEKRRNGKWRERFAAKRGKNRALFFLRKDAQSVEVELPWKEPNPPPLHPRLLG